MEVTKIGKEIRLNYIYIYIYKVKALYIESLGKEIETNVIKF